jgi:hypothetical protein
VEGATKHDSLYSETPWHLAEKHALIRSSPEQTEHVLTALNDVTLHFLLRFLAGRAFRKDLFPKIQLSNEQ